MTNINIINENLKSRQNKQSQFNSQENNKNVGKFRTQQPSKTKRINDYINSKIAEINNKPLIKEYVKAANQNFELAKANVGRGQTANTTLRKRIVPNAG